MRGIPSIPMQIRSEALSGDITKAIKSAKMAHSRNESGLISENITILGLANILRESAAQNDLNKEQIKELTNLLFVYKLNLAAGAVVIRYFIDNPRTARNLPTLESIELLNILAVEIEGVSDSDLIATANSLQEKNNGNADKVNTVTIVTNNQLLKYVPQSTNPRKGNEKL